MTPEKRNVLFLCTGNSARSILAESLLNELGGDRYRAYSAGSKPTGQPNPFALELLDEKGHPLAGLRSKSWDEFSDSGSPTFDVIVTVCANAAGETCPVWPGHPVTVHWGVPDPAAVSGSDDDKRRAFAITYDRLERRIRAFLALELDTYDSPGAIERLGAIGSMSADESDAFPATAG